MRAGLSPLGPAHRGAIALPAIALAIALALASSPPAAAHVGPSPETNNRYLTLVLEPGAVRVVYALFFGDVPGQAARKRMDQANDGVLSEREQDAFAAEIADSVADGLRVELDGEPRAIEWDRVEVGIGAPDVDAGSFSIDMVATLCYEPAGEHALELEEAFRVPPVGEGALALEPGGVEVLRSAMGEGEGVRKSYKWMGLGPVAEEGYRLALRVPQGAEIAEVCADWEERADSGAGESPDGAELGGSERDPWGSEGGMELARAEELAEGGSFGGAARSWRLFAKTAAAVVLLLGIAMAGIRPRP